MAGPTITISAPSTTLVNTPIKFDWVLGGDVNFLWNFGDGTTSKEANPEKSWAVPGFYNVTLTISSSGTSVLSNFTINVTGPPSALSISLPASMTGVVDQPIQFTAIVSGGTAPYDYSWNFGNGNIKQEPQPTFTFQSSGSYNVSLTVNDSVGNNKIVSTTVAVSPLPPPSPSGGLLHKANLSYLGAFRVPAKNPDGSWVNYSNAGYALAFNPTNNSLFVVGNTLGIGEISIPSLSSSSNLSDLKTASILQKEATVLNRVSNPDGDNRIGGLLVNQGKIIGTAYVYYDANATATKSYFILSSTNVISSISGLYGVTGAPQIGYVAGYMCPIPSEFQSSLGATHLTGLADIPIISRSSSGPSAFGFDPTKLANNTSVIPYLYYPVGSELGPYEYYVSPIQNNTTQIAGIVFPSGTSSVLFFGNTGSSIIGYGINSDWGDPGGGKGGHSMNGEYVFQVWAYDVNDLISVRNGRKRPQDIVPYDVWNFTLPMAGYNTNPGGYAGTVGGVAFDPATKRIYISVTGVDNVLSNSYLPVIYCFQLNTSSISEVPRVGVVTGYPSSNATPVKDFPSALKTHINPVNRGETLTLWACNVYYPQGIREVRFSIDGTYVGSGIKSTMKFADHNYSLSNVGTSNLTSGNHTVTAQAIGNDGITGGSTSWSLKIK